MASYSSVMDLDNTSSLHQAMVDPNHLCGPQVIQAMMKTPGKYQLNLWYHLYVLFLTEYLFLNKYYFLLYNSIIPNCRITLPVLHQYYNIGKDMEDYILHGTSAKVCVQRLLNFLLVSLDVEKNYMKFCSVINLITVMTTLSYKMITGNEN